MDKLAGEGLDFQLFGVDPNQIESTSDVRDQSGSNSMGCPLDDKTCALDEPFDARAYSDEFDITARCLFNFSSEFGKNSSL